MTSATTKYILPKGAWMIVFLLFIVGVLNYIDRTMLTTMRTSIVGSIPMTDAQFGLLTSVFLWIYGLLSPVAGYVADRVKRTKVIIGSLIAWSLITLLTGYVTTFNELIVVRALLGVSEAFYMPAALALIVDYHKGETRSLATGINLAGVMLGQTLGFLGGWISDEHSWHFAFKIFGIIGIAYGLILILLLKDRGDQNTDQLEENKEQNSLSVVDTFKYLFSKSSFNYILVFWGLMGVVSWMIVAWLPTYYQERFELSQTKAGLYATAYLYPASILGLLLGGFWTDRWSLKNSKARILLPIIGLVIAAPCVFMASYSSVLYLAIVFFMVYGFTRMFTDTNLMPIICQIVDNRFRATAYGILNMFATMVGGLGIYAAGAMRDHNIPLDIIYRTASITMLVCVFMLFLIKRKIKLT
ncbi:MFS transporter [Pedobacter sp. UBA4863]|uniref:MFS transporter n=1 Tax=Pedobacter sp. UBA4863 TaxID=1947060 RepID=UPI0025E69909|nr:MFS transporter [Pedobacter sp. UBA4863]